MKKTSKRYEKKKKKTSPKEFLIHPLLQYDPDAAKWIKVIRAEYFETCKPPVPRNQDLPARAFGELTGRTILAATSHAWFWQCHPDPKGIKLQLLRDDFIPRLRKRYPETKIVSTSSIQCGPQAQRRDSAKIRVGCFILECRPQAQRRDSAKIRVLVLLQG